MALLGAQFVNAVSPNPVGSLQAYAGPNAPTGWLLCDGSSYSTSAYPELYDAIGYAYGGSGANFNVPDLRGRLPVGKDNMGGTTAGRMTTGQTGSPTWTGNPTTLGSSAGSDKHTLSTAQMPQHNHNVQENSGNGAILGGHFTGGSSSYAGNIASNAYPVFVSNTGSSHAHPNVQPVLVTNYIIRAQSDAPRSGLAYGSTPPIVTQLPSNPQFGDVVTYIADATNGVAWSLQYDGSGSYPWKFVGGPPLFDLVSATGQTTTSSSYTALATAGPTLTLPLAGDYDVNISAQTASTAAAHYAGFSSYDVGATAANDAWAVMFGVNYGPGYGSNADRTYRHTGLAASTSLVAKYRTPQSVQVYFNERILTATPVRVAA